MHVTPTVVGLVIMASTCAFIALEAGQGVGGDLLVTFCVAFSYAAGYVRGRF